MLSMEFQSARLSKFSFVLFCYITNHLMTGPLGDSKLYFHRPKFVSESTLRFSRSGNKIHCSPRVQSLSVKYDAMENIVTNTVIAT